MKLGWWIVSWLAFLIAVAAAAESTPPRTDALVAQGKSLYEPNCQSCHGANGQGNGPAAAYLSPRPRNFTSETFKNGDSEANVFRTITKGLAPSAMPAFSALTEEERWSLVYYVLEFRR